MGLKINDLIESELFGYEKGAFTGADSLKFGKLEKANHGTLFFDEIGDMSLSAQAKILRVIQEGTYERLGGHQTLSIDVRIIAATHKDLESMIEKGSFREDLFYRLNVVPIVLPPLRKRKGDIPILAKYFCERFSQDLNFDKKSLTSEAIKCLDAYSFPGNIRELKNILERIYILSEESEIDKKDILFNIESVQSMTENRMNSPLKFKKEKADFEKYYLVQQLRNNGWNISQTADVIGIKQPNLSRKMKELGIEKN